MARPGSTQVSIAAAGELDYQLIEDCRLKIEYLRSASLRAVGSALYEPDAGGINF